MRRSVVGAGRLLRAPRTLLFVPGDRPERFDKARASGADGVILDLEDAVASARKPQAREAVSSWLLAHTGLVRISAAGSSDCEADLAATGLSPGLAGLMVAKTERREDIEWIADRVGPGTPLIALVESAAGLLAAQSIAEHPAVALLAFGNLDFALDCGLAVEPPLELELLAARGHLVYVSRAAGLPGPLDGVTADVTADEVATRDATRAFRLGFSGKLCIHPRQVPVVTTAFTPTPDELAWATRVVAAEGGGVAVIDGAMVDRPVVSRARRILERGGG